ncbi:ParB/RepB/Spo0J family partition protein [Croceibacterium sp. TMG7-5b_MA50]|uniref:ParB/RepB/Spo0J family partition protein n=1 Tax=Croceibacterium sp. TMG7-5b_MA50 TaxID=3121290 RepID=UPI00322174A6
MSGKVDAARVQRRKLGKGLGALLGEVRGEEAVAEQGSAHASSRAGLASLPVGAIEPHPDQPRRHFDEDALDELAASIAARGVIQPVIVRPMTDGRYQLVAGERRWRAAQRARLHEIPALVRELEERDVMALALIENIQREDLNPVEEARAYHRLSEHESMTQAEIARLVEKSRSHVANLLRLLSLPAEVLDHVEAGRLDMGHARALVAHGEAVSIASRAVAEGLTVRDVERLARKQPAEFKSEPRPKTKGAGTLDPDTEAVQSSLEEFLGLPVRIAPDGDPRSGTISVSYRTLDQLDMLCQRLSGGEI